MVLSHVHRMNFSTTEIIHRMFFQNKTVNAVSQVTSRLVKQGYLNRFPLLRTRSYFTLGNRCMRQFGVPRNKTTPRGEQVLPSDFATLAYCCCGPIVRKRLLRKEVEEKYPWYPKGKLFHPFYIDHSQQQKRLATIRVELSDYPDHIVRKHIRQMHDLRQIDEFEKLLSDDEFMIVTITTTPERTEAIIKTIEEETWYPAYAVYSFSDLLNFV